MYLQSVFTSILIVFISITSVFAASDSEQWCRDNPGVCQCSEPLEATAYNPVAPFDIYYNPNDSSLNQCRQDNQLGAFITRLNSNPIAPTASTNTIVRQRLSLGGTQIRVPAVLKLGENHTGIYEGGHAIQNRTALARVNVRWYFYRSAGDEGDGVNAHVWADKLNGPCNNASKWFEIYWSDGPASSQWDHESGTNGLPNVYAWSRFTPLLTECCNWGPGHLTLSQANTNVTVPQPNGHWFRYEVSMFGNIQGGPGLKMQAKRKDVTANLPEEKIIDTTVTCSGCGTGALPANDWPVEATTALTPPGGLVNPTLQWFKDWAGGGLPQFTACPGSYYISHVVYAGWPTDANQWIGGATEIEAVQQDIVPHIQLKPGIRLQGQVRIP